MIEAQGSEPQLYVALGASGGGLEVFQQFFDAMPGDTGMAFLLVQHLDPKHDTLMPQLLAKHTRMKILRGANGLKVEANCVYVISSSEEVGCKEGILHVGEPRTNGRLIDDFFISLAKDKTDKVVGVVLSGAGSDGSAGIKAIKEQGGLTIAQHPETAKFDGMPRSAISTGYVDWITPVTEMPGRILEYVKALGHMHGNNSAEEVQRLIADALPEIFPILRDKTGHDFSRYKQSTLIRRIQRRLQVVYLDSVEKYLILLKENPDEVEALFKDLLIGVTEFFRDEEHFEALERIVIPTLFEGKTSNDTVRVWVPGCASGEEAYSLAILLLEYAKKLESKPKLQVFATDLDAESLDVARKARYPEEIRNNVPPARLAKYFKTAGQQYEVIDEIRELCVFSVHNLIKDPPFSRLDLLSCRNLLIYLEADLQKRLLPLFHYALNPCGFLFLGPSENIASRSEFFKVIDSKHRIFQRHPTLLQSHVPVPMVDSGQVTKVQGIAITGVTLPREQTLARSIERVILEEYAPASRLESACLKEVSSAMTLCGVSIVIVASGSCIVG